MSLKLGTTFIYKFTMKDAKTVTMNMEDVYLLKGLLTGIEGKLDEVLVSSFCHAKDGNKVQVFKSLLNHYYYIVTSIL